MWFAHGQNVIANLQKMLSQLYQQCVPTAVVRGFGCVLKFLQCLVQNGFVFLKFLCSKVSFLCCHVIPVNTEFYKLMPRSWLNWFLNCTCHGFSMSVALRPAQNSSAASEDMACLHFSDGSKSANIQLVRSSGDGRAVYRANASWR